MASNLPPGVIHLNDEGAGQPRPFAPSQFPTQQPSSKMHYPMHQTGDRGSGIMPPGNHATMQPSPLHPGRFATHNVLPVHHPAPQRPRNNVEIVDIRDQRITEAEARRRLSTYVVIRIEKSCHPNDIDEEGNPAVPAWETASRATETDISQHEASRKVRELDRETESVTDKKRELSSAIQRQLERARNDLQEGEPDDRYEYTLAQLDSKIKRIEHSTDRHSKRDKRKRKESSKSKPRKERVAVIAYFKRAPGPNENCMRMLEMGRRQPGIPPPAPTPPINISFQSQQQPGQFPQSPISQPPRHSPPLFQQLPHAQQNNPPNGPPHPPQNLQPNHSSHHPPKPALRPLSNPAAQQPPPHLPHNQNLPGPPRRPQSALPTPNPPQDIPKAMGNHGKKDNPAIARLKHQASVESHRSSRTSAVSESSFATDDDDSEILTPESSVGSSSRYRREKDRGQSRYRRYRDRGESFGLEVARRHTKRDHRYILGTNSSRSSSPPPSVPDPISNAGDVNLMTAYRQGILDAQAMAQQNMAPAPRVIQHTSGIRAVRPQEIRQSLYHEDLDRMDDQFNRMQMRDDPYRSHEPPPRVSEYITPRTRYSYGSEPQVWVPASRREELQRQRAQAYMRSRQQARDPGPNNSFGHSDRQPGPADHTAYRL